MLKNETLRRDADAIIRASLNAVLPDEAVRRALKNFRPQSGRVLLVAAGKAAWQMAHAAVKFLGRVDGGVVVTKYGHVKGTIPGVDCCEAGTRCRMKWLCRHPESAGTGAGLNGRGYGAVSAFRRRQCAV